MIEILELQELEDDSVALWPCNSSSTASGRLES
jgi:hypothetical protein